CGSEWVAAVAPSLQSALQRPDALDAIFSEEQRHTGAGSFVGSSTVQNDFAIEQQTAIAFLQLFGLHVQSTWNHLGLGFEVYGVAQINNRNLLTGIEFFFQLIHGNAGDAQLPQETLTGDKLVSDIRRKRAND